MGIYADCVFPWGVDKIMADSKFSRVRKRLLANVEGEIFEIGFGTGLNLPHYPMRVKNLITADINTAMTKRAERKLAESNIQLSIHVLNGESLPMDSGSFDCIVSTWTLCSIERVDLALKEIRRLLKPKGRFFFVEHGLSPNPRIQRWQHRLNPIQKIVGCGCRLNRDIKELILGQGFCLDVLNEYYMDDIVKTHSYMYEGIATCGK